MKGRFFRRIFASLALLLPLAAAADEVGFTVDMPMIVRTGEAFRVEFTLNAEPDDASFQAPSFEGFDVLAGPTVSRGRSVNIVNGSMTRSTTCTYTYLLLPQRAGNFTIGEASIAVDKRRYATRPTPIEVVDEAGAAPGAQQTQPSGGTAKQDGAGSAEQQVGKDDILLRLILSRQSVFKGEPLRATVKLYRRVPIADLEGIKLPSFNGFWMQELDTDNVRWQRETYAGKVYESLVIREFLLYPQQSGTLTIEPADITAVAQVVVQSRTPDPFFGIGHETYYVKRRLQTPRTEIQVKELPSGAPAGFNGAVGRFTLESTPPPAQLAANSSGTYTIRITGSGNLPFVQAPKMNFPASFEQYDVKTTEAIKASQSGLSGYRQFEYPFIARAEGEFEIEPAEFSYFDPVRMEYTTLSSQRSAVQITPDANGGDSYLVKGLSKEEVRLLGQDIRFIKLGRAALRSDRQPFFLSAGYFATLAAILAIFAAIYAALRKQIRDRQNLALVRGRRANKVAVQRFRSAKRFMGEQNRHAFYEEMLRALWGYMGDKFNIPVADLTKENVREELRKRGIGDQESDRFSKIVTRCEEAQYSPVQSARMEEDYHDALDLVSCIESAIKR